MASILHHYCIIRNDLPLGVFAAQLLHAAAESNPKNVHANAVVLYSKNLEHLNEIERKLIDSKIDHTAIKEPGNGWNNQLMAIGIFPCARDENLKLRQIVAGLNLVK